MVIKIDSAETVPNHLPPFRITLELRENLLNLKGIKKDYSKQAPEAAGTSIAISLVNSASSDNQCERGIVMACTILLASAANILLAGSTYAIMLWMWQNEPQVAMTPC